MTGTSSKGGAVISNNSKAHFDYSIEETIESGIVLVGTEVKSLRQHRASLTESHAGCDKGEFFLYNFHIPAYKEGNRFNHYPLRPRKLLLHRSEINRLRGLVERKGMSLIPLKMYFDERQRVKLLLGVAKGKKNIDKRIAIKEREWRRDKERLFKQQNS